jgi:RNA polymerase-binding transcription factor DksA
MRNEGGIARKLLWSIWLRIFSQESTGAVRGVAMDSEERERVAARLRELREALLAEQEARGGGEGARGAGSGTDGSAVADGRHATAGDGAGAGRRREIQLQRIEGAFQRLEKGTYGTCIEMRGHRLTRSGSISTRRFSFARRARRRRSVSRGPRYLLSRAWGPASLAPHERLGCR